MAFPASPSNNEVHKEGNRAFVWDSTLGVWDQVRETNRTEVKTITSDATTQGNLTVVGDLVPSTPLSHRNIVINGGMQVAQRGSTAHASSTDLYGAVDRFKIYNTGGSPAFTSTQEDHHAQSTKHVIVAEQGFGKSLKLDLTIADTGLTATDRAEITMHFEGQDLQHLKKGTANAEAVTLSFWISSPKTGVHIVELYDIDNARQISKPYTIAAADTWQKVEVTFEGDVGGRPLDDDSSPSLSIRWWLLAGSNYNSGTLSTTWTSQTAANRAVGQVNCCDSTSNNIFLTGVQLELGSNATPFEHRSYGEQLARCQRYFQKIEYVGSWGNGIGKCRSTTAAFTSCDLITAMRVAPTTITLPTIGQASGNITYLNDEGYPSTHGTVQSTQVSPHSVWIYMHNFSTIGGGTDRVTWAYVNGTAYFKFDSEL